MKTDIFIVVITLILWLVFATSLLFNLGQPEVGKLFAKTLVCEEDEYKVIITNISPPSGDWKIQPDGSYATCTKLNEVIMKKKNAKKAYEEIYIQAIQGYDRYTTVNGSVYIFNKTGYPLEPLAKIDVNYGVGHLKYNGTVRYETTSTPIYTGYKLFSQENYYTVFDGIYMYYDMNYSNGLMPLPDHSITNDLLRIQLTFNDIKKVGYFYPAEHQTIHLRNQTSFDITIGALDPHGYIKNPVLCFDNDANEPFEGNEFLDFYNEVNYPEVSFGWISGGRFDEVPHDITSFVQNKECVPLKRNVDETGDSYLEGGYLGTYGLSFNVLNYQNISERDIMHVWLDDMGSYRGHDLMFYTKAEPLHIATITW